MFCRPYGGREIGEFFYNCESLERSINSFLNIFWSEYDCILRIDLYHCSEFVERIGFL